MDFESLLATLVVEELIPAGAVPPAPDTLYHYTGPAGLKGIVGENGLWFGDSFFLNDASEISYGFEMVREQVSKWGATRSQWQKDLAELIVERTFGSSLGNRPAAFCMSDSANLLNQWRDYGRDQVSYSIGLDAEELRKRLSPDPWHMMLIRLIYEPQAQTKFVEGVVQKVLDAACAQPEAEDNKDGVWAGIADAASLPLCITIATLKHPDFAAEREWRLWTSVEQVLEKQKFRPTPVGIAPYYELKPFEEGAKLPIKSVMVGPSPHGFVAEMGVKLLLRHAGHDVEAIATSHSQIPLRY